MALGANAAFMVVEVAAGLVFGSLALLADAAHMASDVFGLAVALGAQHLAGRPASARHTYGFQRAEVLGALVNGAAVLAVAVWIVFEAFRRLDSPLQITGPGLLAVAAAGLLVNLASALLLKRVQGRNLNMQAAFLHMAADAAGSVGAIAAGLAITVWDAEWVDPAVSIAIAALLLWSTWGLLRATLQVLLEGAPRGIDPLAVERALASEQGVEGVHHLHLWSLASDTPALSAHVVLAGEVSLHEAQRSGDRLKGMLAARFGIEHATLELECHACEPDAVGAAAGATRESRGGPAQS